MEEILPKDLNQFKTKLAEVETKVREITKAPITISVVDKGIHELKVRLYTKVG